MNEWNRKIIVLTNIGNLEKNPLECLETKNTVTEILNSMGRFNSRLYR